MVWDVRVEQSKEVHRYEARYVQIYIPEDTVKGTLITPRIYSAGQVFGFRVLQEPEHIT